MSWELFAFCRKIGELLRK